MKQTNKQTNKQMDRQKKQKAKRTEKTTIMSCHENADQEVKHTQTGKEPH